MSDSQAQPDTTDIAPFVQKIAPLPQQPQQLQQQEAAEGTKAVEGQKSVLEDQQHSIQARATEENSWGSGGVMFYMARAGQLISPWWSRQRDMDLDKFWKGSDHLSATIGMLAAKVSSVPVRVEPRDASMASHRRQAADYTVRLLEESEYGAGWLDESTKFVLDYFTCDNGSFMEVIGDGSPDGPIVGPALGLAHLDSHRCLGRDSRISFADGTTISVADVVRKHITRPVLAMDAQGNLVPANITAWYENSLDNRYWLRIIPQNARRTFGRPQGLWVTNDHPIRCEDGWKRADALTLEDKILTDECQPNPDQQSIIAGTLLGDGHLCRPYGKRQSSALGLTHSEKQIGWLHVKMRALEGLHFIPLRKNKKSACWQVETERNNFFGEWRELWYPNGKKCIPRALVKKMFGPLMLATWYADDGNLCFPNRVRHAIRLYTLGFCKDDVDWLADLLREQGIVCAVRESYKSSGQFLIYIGVEAAVRFFEMVAPYIPQCLRYKLPQGSASYDESRWAVGRTVLRAERIAELRRGDNGQQVTAFCIDVEKHHNFVAGGMVVHNCQRTGEVEYPVRYQDTDGGVYKLHRTRVAFTSDLASPRAEMYGVGFCSLSRSVNVAQHLIDVGVYKQEKLGSRPFRGALFAPGIDYDVVQNAFKLAMEGADNAGLSRFNWLPIIAETEPDSSLQLVSFSSLPDGFNEEISVRLGMFTIALAFGVPIRWIWPTATTGATKGDAMYQHVAGLGGGIGKLLGSLTVLLGGSPRGPRHMRGKFLPPHLKMVFDFQDDEQDRMRAEIREDRATTRAKELESQVIDLRVAREQALSAGDITDANFAHLELESGRLPDGSSVTTLFSSTDNFYLELLDLGVEEPLAIDANDPIDMLMEIEVAALNAQDIAANASVQSHRHKAAESLAALAALKELYMPIVDQQIQADMAYQAEQEGMGQVAEELEAEEPTGPTGPTGPTEPKPAGGEPALGAEGQPEEEEGAKQFRWGARVGEVIRGQLARGAGGRFVSLDALQSEAMRDLLERLRARRGEGGAGRGGAAAAKRAANRALVGKKLGRMAEIEAMGNLRAGEEIGEEATAALIAQRLAQQNPDGSVTMTSAGRKLLGAANSGNVDSAKQALVDAAKTPKGKAGAKPKKDKPEPGSPEYERQRLARNRKRVAKEVGDEVDLNALHTLAEGGTVDEAALRELARRGLVVFDKDGKPHMTSLGRDLAEASNNGKTRNAMNVLMRGRDVVKRVQAEGKWRREQADRLSGEVRELESKLADLQAELAEAARNPAKAGRYDEIKAEVEKLTEALEETRTAAQQAYDQADQLEAAFGGVAPSAAEGAKGGAGSGHHGHEGRPGQVGGSVPDMGAGGLSSAWSTTNHDARGKVDPDKIAAAVRRAVRERPSRASHGYTGKNAFFIADDKIYAWDKWREMSESEQETAIPAHSHSSENWMEWAESQGEWEDFNPHNAGDLHSMLKGYRDGSSGSASVLITGDGRMEILELAPGFDRAVLKLGMKRLQNMLETPYAEIVKWLERNPGKRMVDRDVLLLRELVGKYGLRYRRNLRWREEPSLAKKAAPSRRAVRWLVDAAQKALGKAPAASPTDASTRADSTVRTAAGHTARRVDMACPIPGCDGKQADCYDDHGGLCVCTECGATFDPSVEVAGEDDV